MEQKENLESYLRKNITRRQALKAGGIAALGLAFSKPIIDTIRPTPIFANYEPPPPDGGDGCTPGFWKNHDQSFWPAGITKDNPGATTLGDIFTFPAGSAVGSLASKTFLEALGFPGGSTLLAKTQIMFRAAVASYLNAAKFGSPPFGIPLEDVDTAVNFLLGQTAPVVNEAQLKRDMIEQGGTFDTANNAGDCEFLLDGPVFI